MTLNLLAVGDLHLGRSPGGLPAKLREELDVRDLGPATALRRIVAAATAMPVDAVVFAGDVVEQEDDFFEAYRDLRDAVRTLDRAGITVAAVAGNHDVRVLPHLADEMPAFRLLGRGGNWEDLTLVSRNGTEVVLHGWSFTTPRVLESPLGDYRFPRDLRPTLGLLHCDRDQAGSPHAPVGSRELVASGLDAWLLGHIHRPDALDVTTPSGYLGSATALRRSETGPRGPWLYVLESGGIRTVEQWPLAPLRWEELTVPLDGIHEAADARQRLLHAAVEAGRGIVGASHRPDVLGLRITFTGRTDLRREVDTLLAAEDLTEIPGVAELRCFVGHYRFDTLPEVDLHQLAQRTDPVGLLARRLILLEENNDPAGQRRLLQLARERLENAGRDPVWGDLALSTPTDAELLGFLREAAREGLDALLAQHREPGT